MAQTDPATGRPAQAATDTSGDIVVTANKREERLIDVASSISVVSGADLQLRQAFDLQDIQKSVAGLSLQQGAVPGVTRLILRGQNSGGDGATVASVIDDAPLSFSAANTNGAFVATDIDGYGLSRVEVLRGPQGTLYGATAEGGLIRYVTAPADPANWHFGAEASGTTVAHGGTGGQGRAYVNAPLGGGNALRVTGFYDGVPGWGDNPNLKLTDVNHGRRWGVRGNLLLQPTDTLTIRGLALYQDARYFGNGAIQANGLTNPANPFGLVSGYSNNGYLVSYSHSKYQLYSGNIALDLGGALAQSITSYGKIDVDSSADAPSLTDLLTVYSTLGLISLPLPLAARSQNIISNAKFSQEIRFASQPGHRLFGAVDWQIGFFYTQERTRLIQYIPALSLPSLSLLAPVSDSNLPLFYRDYAGYADATVHLSPAFDIEGGIRVTRNVQRSQLTQGGLPRLVGPAMTFPVVRAAETSTTFQIAPRWHITPDTLLYARVARGYRPGGPQIPVIGAPTARPTTFAHDSTTNYEVGFKGTLFGHRLTLDLAAFYIDWNNVQIIAQDSINGTAFSYTGNAGKAVSKGLEWNIDWRPVRGLDIGLLGSYVDAHLTRDAPALAAVKGNKLPYVNDLTNTVRIDYEAPVWERWRGFGGASWSYFGPRYSDFTGTPLISQTRLPGYSVFDAHLGVRSDRYTVELFAKNLTDKRGITNYLFNGGFGGSGSIAIIRPRTIGLRVAVDY